MFLRRDHAFFLNFGRKIIARKLPRHYHRKGPIVDHSYIKRLFVIGFQSSKSTNHIFLRGSIDHDRCFALMANRRTFEHIVIDLGPAGSVAGAAGAILFVSFH